MSSERAAAARAGVAIAATYVAFLLWAQFGFLAQVRAELASASAVRAVFACMGIAGLAASLVSPKLLRGVAPALRVQGALLSTAAVALVSIVARGPAVLGAIAAAGGASIGVLTVSLAGSLDRFLPVRRPGLVVGAGTGIAYLVSNVPFAFAGSTSARATIAAAACVVAAAFPPRDSGRREPHGGAPSLSRLVVAFLALVVLDSAAFATIQETPSLKALTWGGDARTLGQGLAHLAGALFAGWLLDRGRLAAILAGTWGAFALALGILLGAGPLAAWIPGPLYAVGIAAYSTALAFAPALAGGTPSPAVRAGLLYGIAGWLGSAAGVGAAQDLHAISPALVAGAGAAVLAALAWPRRASWRPLARRFGVAASLAAIGAIAIGVVRTATAPSTAVAWEPSAERGREVYVSEGCIHCHSQYVRPEGGDGEAWGPVRPLDRSERPVLVGNRRQGPDLANVGNRRGPVWQELHLRDPRALDPASRMPSYARLFDDERGADLVAYLGTLGAGTRPPAPTIVRARGEAGHGKRLFGTWCAPCHGRSGSGDGPLADRVGGKALLDLHKEKLLLFPSGDPSEEAIATLIRRGAPPTAMAGHETLPDADVADVAAYVRSLR